MGCGGLTLLAGRSISVNRSLAGSAAAGCTLGCKAVALQSGGKRGRSGGWCARRRECWWHSDPNTLTNRLHRCFALPTTPPHAFNQTPDICPDLQHLSPHLCPRLHRGPPPHLVELHTPAGMGHESQGTHQVTSCSPSLQAVATGEPLLSSCGGACKHPQASSAKECLQEPKAHASEKWQAKSR